MVEFSHLRFHRFAEIISRHEESSVQNSSLASPANIAYSFSHGLAGVDQGGNYRLSRALAISFGILAVGTLVARICMRANNHLRHMSAMSAGDRQQYWMHEHSSWRPWFKKNIIYAPLWKNRHNREIQLSSAINVGTLPSRFHMILLVSYAICNIVYCLLLPWGEKESASTIAALRGRSGTLAVLNLVPTILFAMRNNPLIWMLHVSYDTFNLLHRWFARMVIFEAVVHTICWLVNTVRGKGWSGIGGVLAAEPSYTWGMVGTAFFCLIFIQAWSPVRHAFYETFLNVHRIAVALAFVGVWVHIDVHHLPQLPWVELALGLWIGEWVWRSAKLIYYNIGSRQFTRVTVEAMPNEACRVTADLVRPWGKIKPGSHVHIYLPTLSLWSSHPFSVAWSDVKNKGRTMALEDKLPTTETNTHRLEAQEHHSVSLVIRARTGMTRKLFERASAQQSGVLRTYGLIEGPYGGHESLKSYGTTVLFAAGVGITHQVSQVRLLVAGFADGTVATRKVILVWTVPNTETLEWVRPWMDEILRMPGRRDCLKILLFVTKPRSHADVVQSGTGTVQMFPGRCNPSTVLDKELESRIGATCVTVCGPGAFADGVRAAVRQRQRVGNIDFIEEAFTY